MGAQASTASFEGDVPNLSYQKPHGYGLWDGAVQSFRLESTSALSRFRIRHAETGKYLNLDGDNNGILDDNGIYFSVHTPGDIYNPNGLNAHALRVESGPRTGAYLRHSGMVVHGNPWEGNNYDFSWVFVDRQDDGSFTMFNYYGSDSQLTLPGYFLNYANNYVQIFQTAARWAAVA